MWYGENKTSTAVLVNTDMDAWIEVILESCTVVWWLVDSTSAQDVVKNSEAASPSKDQGCARFPEFSAERKEIGSLSATESEVWIGKFNVREWKTTEQKFLKIWRSLAFCKNSGKRAHPWVAIYGHGPYALLAY